MREVLLLIAERKRGEANASVAILNGQKSLRPRQASQFGETVLKIFEAANTMMRGFDNQISRPQLPVRNLLRLRICYNRSLGVSGKRKLFAVLVRQRLKAYLVTLRLAVRRGDRRPARLFHKADFHS